MSVSWLTVVQLVVSFCSNIPVVFSDNPGISKLSQQCVSFKSFSFYLLEISWIHIYIQEEYIYMYHWIGRRHSLF